MQQLDNGTKTKIESENAWKKPRRKLQLKYQFELIQHATNDNQNYVKKIIKIQ